MGRRSTEAEPRRDLGFELPAEARIRDGFTYDPREDAWEIITPTGKHHFRFGDLRVAPTLVKGLKALVMNVLRKHPEKTAKVCLAETRGLLKHIATYDPKACAITAAHLANYRASLGQDQLYRSTVANNEVRRWARLNIPGIEKGAVTFATEAERHGSPGAGKAVRLSCPIHGAYSDLEDHGLHKALHAAFAAGRISIANYGLCLLNSALGSRPVQLASLRICDLKVSSGPAGNAYTLSIPRAKQRGGRYRGEFTDRPLIEEYGLVIEAQVNLVSKQARTSGMEDCEQAPLFPCVGQTGTFYGDGSIPAPPTPDAIAHRIKGTMGGLGVRSERTGDVINVNPTRARRTVGTRAAQAGTSLAEIAAVLDHTVPASAMIYVEIRSGLLQRLDKKMALHLAPLAQRFAGTLVSRSHDGEHDGQRHIYGVVREGEGPQDVGGCGKHGFCGLGKPIACYTCRLFQPWDDGPHEAALEWLIERRRKLESGSLVVAASLDDSIVACAEVVRLCAVRSKALEAAPHG